MELNPGDLFIVTRGFRLGSLMPVFAFFGEGSQKEEEPQYDRSHEDRVFRAIEVCGPSVVAEIVYELSSFGKSAVGARRQINTREVEIWPVTPQYLAALQEPPKCQS